VNDRRVAGTCIWSGARVDRCQVEQIAAEEIGTDGERSIAKARQRVVQAMKISLLGNIGWPHF
jgi:hypothetical protein